ncbi:MAG: hypothetical protein HGB35_00085 [Geobacteraceae bacterium]|nr:hypothetical protein [Geobacteraceae bacterium]
MNIVGDQGSARDSIAKLIDRAQIRRYLEIVGNEAKEFIYDETLEGRFANGGPFQYRWKEYEKRKRSAGRFRGHVDFFGFSHPNTINTMMASVTDERYTITITGDAAEKTLKWRGRYNWFSFGGNREEPISAIADKVFQAFDWGV